MKYLPESSGLKSRSLGGHRSKDQVKRNGVSEMTVYKDGKKGWRYNFQLHGVRYSSKHFSKKTEAIAARESARKKIMIQCKAVKNKIEPDFSNYDIFSDVNTFEELKAKYATLYQDPHNTIASLFEMIMIDIGIPVKYKQLVDCIKQTITKKKEKIPASLRVAILSRDKYSCQMCGRTPPDVKLCIDHIVPISKGGITEERNLQALCFDCNVGKSNTHIMVKG